MKLKETDKKLLGYLYHHNRESISKIAKETGISRDKVEYRLKKWIREGLIKKFFLVVDYSKLGYNNNVIALIKLQKPSEKSKIEKILGGLKNKISYGDVFGKYDLVIHLIFRNDKETSDFFANLLSENIIEDYLLIRPYDANLYPLKWANVKKKEKYSLVTYGPETKLDSKEIKILKELSKDARMKLLDLSTKIGISPELAFYKLKKLKKEGVILGSRIQFDITKLGYYYSNMLITFKKFSRENQEKIKIFAKNSPYVNSSVFSLTRPNCFIQLFHREQSELQDTIRDFRKSFEDEEFSLEIISVHEDEEINPLPFL